MENTSCLCGCWPCEALAILFHFFLSCLSLPHACTLSSEFIRALTSPSVSLHISPSLSFSFKQSLFWVYWPHLSRSKNTFSLFVTFFFFTSSAFFGCITLMFSSILFLPLLVLMLANCPLFNRHQHFFQARRVEKAFCLGSNWQFVAVTLLTKLPLTLCW